MKIPWFPMVAVQWKLKLESKLKVELEPVPDQSEKFQSDLDPAIFEKIDPDSDSTWFYFYSKVAKL